MQDIEAFAGVDAAARARSTARSAGWRAIGLIEALEGDGRRRPYRLTPPAPSRWRRSSSDAAPRAPTSGCSASRRAGDGMIETIFWVLLLDPHLAGRGAWAIDRLLQPAHARAARRRGCSSWYPRSLARAPRRRDGRAARRTPIADGRDGPRMTLDVAREGVAERRARLRAGSRSRPASSSAWAGRCSSRRASSRRSCSSSTCRRRGSSRCTSRARRAYLVAGAMAGIGLLLVDRGMRKGARAAAGLRSPDRARVARRAARRSSAASRSASSRVGDLEHVLGVLLARARQVERAEEHGVVGHRHLGVHVVVDARRARRASSACRGTRRGSARAAAPSSASAGSRPTGWKTWRDLRRVADAGDVDAAPPRSPRPACRGSGRR